MNSFLAIALCSVLSVVLSCILAWGGVTSAIAAPSASAPELFEQHCSGCHIGGGNIIRRGKNLKLQALQRNHVDTPEAIATLITNGKANMSAYGDRLSPEEIDLLTTYVLEQAQTGWKS